MKILFVGDVFGTPGRRAVEDKLKGLREELQIDYCIVNGENARRRPRDPRQRSRSGSSPRVPM